MKFEGRLFEDDDVLLDGNEYVKCTFRRSNLIFHGVDPTTLQYNLLDDCRWSFGGPAARTVAYMSDIYNRMGEFGRQHIEATFQNIRTAQLGIPSNNEVKFKPRVFIGHGRSGDHHELGNFLMREGLEVETFEAEPRAGRTVTDVLESMAARASIAFLVHTAEDEQLGGGLRARQNVVHETGVFQGRLGFKRALVVREERCESFSNLDGVQEIRFQRGRLRGVFNDVKEVIEREFGSLD